MLTFDVAMPLTLFAVTVVALLLSGRVEPKLKTTFEEREFKARDAVLFVVLIAVAVSVVVFVPGMALVAVFLFSYCSLLFTFSFLFSGVKRRSAQFFFLGIGLAGLVAGAVALLKVYGDGALMFYGGLAAVGLAVFAFVAVLYEQFKPDGRSRWYLAVFPPVLFLVVFFLFMYEPVPLLSLVLLDVAGALFAVLITLYLASLFTWKVAFIFAALLTVMDIILVLFTGVMVTAATHVAGLGLPVLISMPIVPLVLTTRGISFLSLGLGDFFFAGTLATQTYKRYGRRAALVSAVAMTLSFGVFEVLLLNTEFGAFPGTVMIILGWLPVVVWKLVVGRKNKIAVNNVNVESKVRN
ncbi:MAG TPA: hypothetical protein VJ507_03795 [Candidatus Bathyarchaeia archaeon]|nr:hypothetical protein [Candidatus Bathyarchaeia archaeon]